MAAAWAVLWEGTPQDARLGWAASASSRQGLDQLRVLVRQQPGYRASPIVAWRQQNSGERQDGERAVRGRERQRQGRERAAKGRERQAGRGNRRTEHVDLPGAAGLGDIRTAVKGSKRR